MCSACLCLKGNAAETSAAPAEAKRCCRLQDEEAGSKAGGDNSKSITQCYSVAGVYHSLIHLPKIFVIRSCCTVGALNKQTGFPGRSVSVTVFERNVQKHPWGHISEASLECVAPCIVFFLSSFGKCLVFSVLAKRDGA